MSTWQTLQDAATAADIGTSDDAAWAEWWIGRARETADRLDAVTAERDAAREGLDAAHAVGYREAAREMKAKLEAAEERGKRLAETIRDSWQAEVAVLEAEIEGLTAERDKYRIDAEALRARVAELEDALRLIAKSQCPRDTPCCESENCVTEWCDGCVARRALIDAARNNTKET